MSDLMVLLTIREWCAMQGSHMLLRPVHENANNCFWR